MFSLLFITSVYQSLPYIFGTNLITLRMEAGGVWPIAVGCTLCRLAAKYASLQVREEIGKLLASQQLGYGAKRGAEAAVHAARTFFATCISIS